VQQADSCYITTNKNEYSLSNISAEVVHPLHDHRLKSTLMNRFNFSAYSQEILIQLSAMTYPASNVVS